MFVIIIVLSCFPHQTTHTVVQAPTQHIEDGEDHHCEEARHATGEERWCADKEGSRCSNYIQTIAKHLASAPNPMWDYREGIGTRDICMGVWSRKHAQNSIGHLPPMCKEIPPAAVCTDTWGLSPFGEAEL